LPFYQEQTKNIVTDRRCGPVNRILESPVRRREQTEEARRVMAEALERFGAEFRPWLLANSPNNRVEDHEHLIEGYRKAGLLEK